MNSLDSYRQNRLCEIQGEMFARSLKRNTSSSDFIKSFFKDEYVNLYLDDRSYFSNFVDIFTIEKHIKTKEMPNYRQVKYSETEMHWIGYILRFWSLKENVSSKYISRFISPSELRSSYLTLHSQSVEAALQILKEKTNFKKISW